MEAEQTAEEILTANAARAAKLAMFCLVVAVLVLAIDHRLKREIIHRGQDALRLLDEARKLAEEAKEGGPIWASRPDRTAPGTGQHADNGMVHDAGASAAAGDDAGASVGSAGDGEAGQG